MATRNRAHASGIKPGPSNLESRLADGGTGSSSFDGRMSAPRHRPGSAYRTEASGSNSARNSPSGRAFAPPPPSARAGAQPHSKKVSSSCGNDAASTVIPEQVSERYFGYAGQRPSGTAKRASSAAVFASCSNAPSTPTSANLSERLSYASVSVGGSVGIPTSDQRHHRVSADVCQVDGDRRSSLQSSFGASSRNGDPTSQRIHQYDVRARLLEERQYELEAKHLELEQLMDKFSNGFPDMWRMVEEQIRRVEMQEARLEDWMRKAEAQVVLRSHIWGEDSKMLRTKLEEVEERLPHNPLQADCVSLTSPLHEDRDLLDERDVETSVVSAKDFQRLAADVHALQSNLNTSINDLTESLGNSLGDMRAEIAGETGNLEMRIEHKLAPVIADVERHLREAVAGPVSDVEDVRRYVDERALVCESVIKSLQECVEGIQRQLPQLRGAFETSQNEAVKYHELAVAHRQHVLQVLAEHHTESEIARTERQQMLSQFYDHQAASAKAMSERDMILQNLQERQRVTLAGDVEVQRLSERIDGIYQGVHGFVEQLDLVRASIASHEKALATVLSGGAAAGGYHHRGRPETPRPLASAEHGNLLQEIRGLKEYVDACMATMGCAGDARMQIVLPELGGAPVSELLICQERRLAELEVVLCQSQHGLHDLPHTQDLTKSSPHQVPAASFRSLQEFGAPTKTLMRLQSCEAAIATVNLEMKKVRQDVIQVWQELHTKLPSAMAEIVCCSRDGSAGDQESQANAAVMHPACTSCGSHLYWDDCIDGAYEYGWKCENYTNCGGSSLDSPWRWRCEQRHDFCIRCIGINCHKMS